MWDLTRPIGALTIVGIVAGAATAAATTQSMRALLHGIAPIDPTTFLAIPLAIGLLVAASVLAAASPILKTDLAVTLRSQG